ncbi:hypothetical protein Ndes2526B_g00424 [Nannochloris sp. 'desiccata']|nr:putative Histone deacetylase RPD3 [Chlorella desiccata (nom. nud.)]
MTGYSDQYDFPSEDPYVPAPSVPPPLAPRIPTDQESNRLPNFLQDANLAQPTPDKIYYFKSPRLADLARQSHVNKDRAILLNSLLNSLGLLNSLHVEESRPATVEELSQYHSDTQYLTALANYQLFSPRQLAQYGLVDDCAPYPGMFEHACLCVGGSIQAAAALAERRCKIAINFDGGRHHAIKAKASGFCYVNDVVLAILRLLSTFKRVLYLDIDVHHGDAVEEAFKSTERVLTTSIHHSSPGYFPGTGGKLNSTNRTSNNGSSINNNGKSNISGKAEGFALNLPLEEGLKDGLFLQAFSELCNGIAELYRPECIVMCCGVDGLANDPIGRAWSLTPAAYGAATAQVASYGVPILLLGGGGYDSAAACCAFAAALAGITGQALPEDVPQHHYLDRYGPSYSLINPGRPSLAPDMNNDSEVEGMCESLLSVLRSALEKKHAVEQQKLGGNGENLGGGDGGLQRVVQAKRMKLEAHR